MGGALQGVACTHHVTPLSLDWLTSCQFRNFMRYPPLSATPGRARLGYFIGTQSFQGPRLGAPNRANNAPLLKLAEGQNPVNLFCVHKDYLVSPQPPQLQHLKGMPSVVLPGALEVVGRQP